MHGRGIFNKMQKYVERKERDCCLDYIRIIAIILVVFIHSYENYYSINSTSGYLMGRMGTPLFIMLTGATMVRRDYSDIYIKKYLKKIIQIYLVSVLWLFVYRIGAEGVKDNLVHSLELLASAKHLWYLNLLVIIYLSLPFLSYMNSLETRKVLLLFAGTLLLCVLQNFNSFNTRNGYIYAYVYLIWGYLCYERKILVKVSSRVLFGILIFLFLISIALLKTDSVRAYYEMIGHDIWWYDSPNVMFPSLALFPLLLKAKSKKNATIFSILSKCAFGVYIFHLFVIELLSPYIGHINEKNGTLGTMMIFILALLCSFGLSYVVGKIPMMKKTILQ